jgi:hypothetical protein
MQFDDQRGPLRPEDLELPDFLKPKPPEFPQRRSDMHNSDTSLYEPPNTEERNQIKNTRKLSNSEENLSNTSLVKHLRPSSRSNSSRLSLQGGGTNVSATPGGKLTYMDMSFSHDGVLPSHLEAEDYFSHQIRSASPDFTDHRLMEKSLADIGMTANNSAEKREAFRQPASQKEEKVAESNFPVPAPRSTKHPVPRRRRNIGAKSISDKDSTCSEISDTAEKNSLNSEDLNSTLLPPSVSTSEDDQKNYRPYQATGGYIISPQRPLRPSPQTERGKNTPSWQHALRKNSSSESSLDHRTSRSTTPSPTTHDLVLVAESSSDEHQIPTPKKRQSIAQKPSSLSQISEQSHVDSKSPSRSKTNSTSKEQVSYV